MPREHPRAPRGAAAARELARHIAALEDGPIRTRAAARALAGATPGAAALLVGEALRWAARGRPMLARALGEALAHPAPELGYEEVAAVYAEAVARGAEEVCAFLVAPAPAQEGPRRPSDPSLATLSLGHKKSAARLRRDPDLLSRLGAEGEASVVRELLRNPRVTEDLVVRVAARRPSRAEALRAIQEDARWSRRPAVARAIAMNPYAEPGMATKLLPRLSRPALALVASNGSLHRVVRALARRLLDAKGDGGGRARGSTEREGA